jgi:hypothetical protein
MTRGLVTLVLVLALAGCGESRRAEPRLPAPLAADLATYADDVAALAAAGDPCAAREQALALQRATIAAINAHRVPAALQEPLQSAANDLLQRLTCPAPATGATQAPKERVKKSKKAKEEGD